MNSTEENSFSSTVPKEIFSDSTFLKSISFLEDVEKIETSLSIAAQEKPKDKNYGDVVNEYILNTLGYRGPEIKKAPVVFAGCSVTFGVGVPYEAIWATIVGERLGLDYINLGVPGWSAQAIVDNLFKYFYTYGNPENLFVVFPDYRRLVLTSNYDFCRVGQHDEDWPLIQVQHAQLNSTPTSERPKYAKKPYEFTDFIGPEYSLLQTFRSINALISYCKVSNIKLVWSTWDVETNEIIDFVKKYWNKTSYGGYVFSKFSFNGKRQPVETNYFGCHSEYVDLYGDSFFQGQDGVADKTGFAHPGAHYHIHLAEKMFEKLKAIE